MKAKKDSNLYLLMTVQKKNPKTHTAIDRKTLFGKVSIWADYQTHKLINILPITTQERHDIQIILWEKNSSKQGKTFTAEAV